MIYAIKVIVGFLLPPGTFVILLALSAVWLRHLWPLPIGVGVIAILLYVLSIPLTADWVIRTLESRFQPAHSQLAKADVLVMLGAGATLDTPNVGGLGNLSGSGANRLLTTADLYNQTKLPIIVSGGQVFPDDGNEAQIAKHALTLLGVPGNKVILEDQSKNTEQNALYATRLLQQHEFTHPLLITSAFHMQRAVLYFHRHGVAVLPYPTDYQVSQSFHVYVNQFVPSAQSLSLLSTAIHEYLGVLAARLKLPS